MSKKHLIKGESIANLDPVHDLRRGFESRIEGLNRIIAEGKKWAGVQAEELERERARFAALAAIKEPILRGPLVKLARSGGHHAHGAVLVNWSDWHVAEVVDKSKIHGKNAYSPEIARKRSRTCAESTVRLWRHTRASYAVDTMVLFLGGDFISGYLHEELAQTNAMAPIQEARFAEELLMGALDLLVNEKSIKRLHIVGMSGNHGRTSKKMQFKNNYETSYESFIYWHLQDMYASDQVTFSVPKGDVEIVEVVADFKLRLYHGHQIKYNDGMGGLTIPLNKWQAKQQSIGRADFNLMGHYHTFSQPNAVTCLNGSLKGFDEYAASHGFPCQPPLQSFVLYDINRRLIVQTMPVFCS